MTSYSPISEFIDIMQAKGLDLRASAGVVGISYRHLKGIANRERNASVKLLAKIILFNDKHAAKERQLSK